MSTPGGGRLAWLPAPGTLLVVTALMAGLFGIDRWLAALETREVNAEAGGLYAAGERLLQADHAAAAVDDFRRAHYLDRENRVYELALASAQLASGRRDEAAVTLQDLLDSDSNDARANLWMARTLVSSRDWAGADSYYHRAIYGAWHGNGGAEKNKVRLELAELLAKQGKKQELLSEVLLLANDTQSDATLKKKIAAFYLEAGSAARAADAYQTMLRDNRQDGDAYFGLGQAELQTGAFREAQAAFRSAARLDPNSVQIAARVDVAEKLANVDPTARKLSSAEKFRRSQEILGMTEDAGRSCLQKKVGAERLRVLVDSAKALRAQKVPLVPSNEAAEDRLAISEQIWKARGEACGPAPVGDVLTFIQNRLAQ